MPSPTRMVLLAAAVLLLLLMGSCVARNVAATARSMREQQCSDRARTLGLQVEMADEVEAQGRPNVHGVKAASLDARAA